MMLKSMLIAVLGALAAAFPALARPVAAPPALERADVEAWLDGYMPNALQQGDIAGAVVVVVKDGKVLLQKGYGFSDVERRTPVDPERTLFRPGSISKTFAWTAVMQQVEAGRLDLDADVNRYLDFRIPARDGKPVTLRNLMTHTAGFEDTLRDLVANGPEAPMALDAYLKRWVPPRIYTPGTTPAYSNYGTALAGYIAARVAGETSFNTYVEGRILGPLGMTRSTFRQPLPAQLQPLMSQGYDLGSGKPKPYEMFSIYPAGGMATTGADMARFMIAHLNDGAYGDVRILKPETARTMHRTTLAVAPGVNRMALGFYQHNRNGHTVIAHGGDSLWFHSDMSLFIDDGVGLFVSLNSRGRDAPTAWIRRALFEGFADRYFPGRPLASTVDAQTAAAHARLIAGRYEGARKMESTPLKLINLVTGQLAITANPDGTITASNARDADGALVKWREVRPFVWQDEKSQETLGAKVEEGKVALIGLGDDAAIQSFTPIPFHKSIGFILPGLAATLGALLLTVLTWPLAALARRRYGAAFTLTGHEAAAYRAVRGLAIVVLATAAGVVWSLLKLAADFTLLSSRYDAWVTTLHLLCIAGLVGGTAAALWNMVLVWRESRGGFARAWSVALAASFLFLLWFGISYRLVGFELNY